MFCNTLEMEIIDLTLLPSMSYFVLSQSNRNGSQMTYEIYINKICSI